MRILGISCFYHESAAALIDDGEIVASAALERFSRKKHDASFPQEVIDFCLKEGNISADNLDYVVFYEKPFRKFERNLIMSLAYFPKSHLLFVDAMRNFLTEKLWIKSIIASKLRINPEKILFVPHHLSHAAASFYPSGFSSAAILIVDGVGEWATTSIGKADNSGVRLCKELRYPDSLGLLYSAFTQYTGFRVNFGEYKLMGLAPYGEPIYKGVILDKIIKIKEDGSYKLNLDYFDFHLGESTINSKFEKLFKAPARTPDEEIRKVDMDVASSIQEVINEVMLRLAKTARLFTKENRLVIGGGVGLNCVANGFIAKHKVFDNVWIQPAPGDAGGALGAALYAYYDILKNKPNPNHSNQGASLLLILWG